MSVPFVGRRPELDALAPFARPGQRGGLPVAALITGEPGTGKTRLLAEVLASQRATAPIKIVGFEPNARVPLAAVGEVLRRLSAVPGHGPRLEALAFGDVDQRAREPLRIFEAAHRALSSFGPLLIAVDDLQWVDDQSLGLMQYLLRAADASRQPLSVIAAGRPSSASSAYRAAIEGSLPAERRVVIELGPLPLAEGLSLARAIDQRLDEVTAIGLWRRSRGSPFWLEALARSSPDADPSRLIGRRLEALDGEAGALLAALAIGARPFLVDEIAELLNWADDRVHHASRELITHGLGAGIALGRIRREGWAEQSH